jgi:alpha-galactosidase
MRRTLPVILLVSAALLLAIGFVFTSLTAKESNVSEWLAPTPPMGWNSWDAYGTAVREQDVKANADYMAKHLAKYGWQYIVVDIQWYEPNTKGHEYVSGAKVVEDAFGRLLPAVDRFPSAANGMGFKPLADYVHSKGLRFGIHVMRGIPRQAVRENLPVKGTSYHAADIADKDNACRWNPDMWGVDTTQPGAQAYYDSLAELYASWGVDFIKADDMGSHLYQPSEIKALSLAIRKTGRPIVLSLSPGPAPISEVDFFRKYAQMWRISDDFWDNWPALKKQFEYTTDWAPLIRPGAWPDADMLPLGKVGAPNERGERRWSGFTHDEQVSVMTLWSMFRSPLMFGGDLPSNDDSTLSLITNPEVLEVDQKSSSNHQSFARGDVVVWLADVPGTKDHYIAIFNIGDAPAKWEGGWEDLGIDAKSVTVRDLWQHRGIGKLPHMQVDLRPHACVLYRVASV